MDELPFQVERLSLPGVLLIRPKVWSDVRGFSGISYDPGVFKKAGIPLTVAYEYTSVSKKGVLRGMHFQKAPFGQDKLVRCSHGEIFDVAADVNSASSTYGQHVSVHLKAEEQSMLFIPGTYAHGFCVLSDEAVTEYKLGAPRSAENESGARWDDPVLNIAWLVQDPVLTEKDGHWPTLSGVSRS